MRTQLTDVFPFNKYDCKCIKQLHTAQLRSNKNTGTPYRLFLYKSCTVVKLFFFNCYYYFSTKIIILLILQGGGDGEKERE